MRKLVFLICLTPALAFGQRYDISDVAGYGSLAGKISNPWQYGTVKNGISNLLSFDYHLSNTFSVGALWLVNSWNATGQGFGIAGNCHISGFYAGIDVTDLIYTAHPQSEPALPAVSYKPALSTGLHIGGYRYVYKFVYLKEQIGVNYSGLTFGYNTLFKNGAYMESWYNEKGAYIYIQLGISFLFGPQPPMKPKQKEEQSEPEPELE